MAEPNISEHAIKIEHVKITSTKTFADVEATLERSIPQIDPAIMEALAKGDSKRANELAHGSESLYFRET